MRKRFLNLLLLPALVAPLALAVTGCDDDDDGDENTAGDGDGDGAGDGDGDGDGAGDGDGDGDGDGSEECGSLAGQPCGDDCIFDPATIDCATACANVAAICSTNECDENCTGLNQDVALCTAGCEGTKAMHCANVTFACYAMNTDCTGVGTCVNDNI